jgi:hypothetical protein
MGNNMKKIVTMIVEQKDPQGDIDITFPEFKKTFSVTWEMREFGDNIPDRPRRFIYKGKLTDEAKEWIDWRAQSDGLFFCMLRIILLKKNARK